jgi:hypothetical protein
MYATFDRNSPASLSADILSLSWKGDSRQGWLAAGNSRKTVGVTYTEVKDCEDESWAWEPEQIFGSESALERQGMRRNFNFREHSAEVTIVEWNKHLDKIATCDASGTVIVWRNHNGRSVMELVNNRGTPISDFKWSNDGNKVLIAYTDGYILLGTAYGRRIWARPLNLGSFITSPTNNSQNSKLLSSTWSPDDSRIVIGSSIGELIELNATHGGMLVSTTEVLPGIGIIGLEWVVVPKTPSNSTTNGGETTAVERGTESGARPGLEVLADGQGHLEEDEDANKLKNSGNVRLSLYLRNGKVVLMNSCGDQQATIIRTGLMDGRMSWAGNGSVLAVAGFRKSQSISTVRFFHPTGQLLFTLSLGTKEPITAMTWAHGDQKIFIATKNLLHSLSVHRGIPSLQSLCQKAIAQYLPAKEQSYNLVLPLRLKVSVAEAFDPVVQGHIPHPHNLLDYITRPPPHSHRTYCTVIPNTTMATSSNHHGNHHQRRHPSSYTLYVEHLGTLIPILVGHKRSTKIRQSFTISLPNRPHQGNTAHQPRQIVLDTTEHGDLNESTDSTLVSQNHVRGLSQYSQEGHNSLNTESGVQLACREDDTESSNHVTCLASPPSNSLQRGLSTSSDHPHQLAEVTSNVMASKFKIQSLTDKLPSDMGTILIKTSFLHIQPRKVIVCLPQLEDRDSGVDSDCSSSSDESSDDPESPHDSFDLFVPQDELIDSITSMEDLLLPKAIDLESQSLRPIETQSFRPHSNSCGPSFGMGRAQISGGGISTVGSVSASTTPSSSTEQHVQIHSKTPTWNEQHMIYQLDFGGRVTTKSAKNFQLELDGEQVLQFGKIDNGSFILDFQAPFSPVQAFATALANLV